MTDPMTVCESCGKPAPAFWITAGGFICDRCDPGGARGALALLIPDIKRATPEQRYLHDPIFHALVDTLGAVLSMEDVEESDLDAAVELAKQIKRDFEMKKRRAGL